MTPVRARVVAIGALTAAALGACGGQAFSVATSGDASVDGTTGASVDAASENAATEAAPEGMADATSDGGPDDAEASVDSSRGPSGGDAQWVPDVIEPPPAHCTGGFACTPAVPSGWSGPMEVYAGSTTPPAGCSANFEGPIFSGGDGPTAGSATCDCQCGPAENVQCPGVDVSFYAGVSSVGSACNAPMPCAQRSLTPAACTTVNGAASCDAGAASIRMPVPVATGGGCTPMPTKSIPPPSWTVSTLACISALGRAPSDCPARQQCSPLPSAPFGSSLCIAQAGVLICPSADYTARRIYYGGFDDSRDCSACGCGDVTGATCSATLEVFTPSASPTGLGCTAGQPIDYIAPVSCAPVQQPGDFRLTTAIANAGTCAGSPVTPTGGVSPSGPTTFCCLP